MIISNFTEYYTFFNQLIELADYVKVEMTPNYGDEELVCDQVLIKDVYHGMGELQVKCFSKNLQLALIVPHHYFKTIANRSINELIDSSKQGIDALDNLIHQELKNNGSVTVIDNKEKPDVLTKPQYQSSQKQEEMQEIKSKKEIKGVDDKFVFTVSSITAQFKKILTNDFQKIWVKGEVHDAKVSPQGHIFFNLRDQEASLSCVMYAFQAKKIKFKIESGIVFECFGNVSIYDKRGVYQLIVERLVLEGQGEFDLAFKQLRRKLEMEGLFDNECKKPIPLYPRRVGIITSIKGAAFADILKATFSEFQYMDMVIFPCLVQGEHAAQDIAGKISYVNQAPHLGVDTLLVSRGGGSTEDLWAFNEEVVARAVFNSGLPVISAVGHEVDWTICDLVADYRCATPTAAGRFIAQGKKNLQQDFFILTDTLKKSMKLLFEGIRYRVKDFSSVHLFQILQSMIVLQKRNLNEMYRQMYRAVKEIISTQRNRLTIETSKLQTLAPEQMFKRGYMVLKKNNEIVSNLSLLEKDDVVDIISDRRVKQAKIL